MAHSFTTNQTPTTGSRAMYMWIATMLAAGWTKVADSDGTTYDPSGAQITSGASGANGLANAFAWVVLEDPNGVRQFCLQRSSSGNVNWRWKYSYLAKFIGGSPSATQVPSATDEQVFVGGGSDASPTFQQMLSADGGYTFNTCACDTTLGYSFYWMSWLSGNPNSTWHGVAFDVLTPGSYSSSDVDPAWLYRSTISSGTSNPFAGNEVGHTAVVNSWSYFKASGVPTWLPTQLWTVADQANGLGLFGAYSASNGGNTHGLSANSWDGTDDGLPAIYGRSKAPGTANGFKGFGSMLRMMAPLRALGDTYSINAGSKNYINMGCVGLPWDGSTPVL